MTRYSKDPAIDLSLRHSIRDAAAYSIMTGAGETYFSAFAIFLRASVAQIALLSSLPPLLGSLTQLLGAWWAGRGAGRKCLIVAGASLHGLSWLPLMALPLLFPDNAVPLFIACVTFYYAAANVVAPAWASLMGDLVPERKRGRYFARRTALASVTALAALVVAGSVLDVASNAGLTLAGYLAVFGAAAVARFISVYHLTRMVEPQRQPYLSRVPGPPRLKPLSTGHVARFSLFVASMQMAVAVAGPFFAVYMLRELHFSYLQFMANTAMGVLAQFLTLNTWGRLSDAFGNRIILVLTGCLLPLLPVLWLLSTDFWYLLAVQIVAGFSWAGFSLSAGNFLYDLLPAPARTNGIAVHNIRVAIGVFGGALAGGQLAAHLPHGLTVGHHSLHWGSALYGVFLISALARLTVAAVFLPRLREVRTVRPTTLRILVFRATRFSALQSLFFDVVARVHRSERGPP